MKVIDKWFIWSQTLEAWDIMGLWPKKNNGNLYDCNMRAKVSCFRDDGEFRWKRVMIWLVKSIVACVRQTCLLMFCTYKFSLNCNTTFLIFSLLWPIYSRSTSLPSSDWDLPLIQWKIFANSLGKIYVFLHMVTSYVPPILSIEDMYGVWYLSCHTLTSTLQSLLVSKVIVGVYISVYILMLHR